MLSYHIEKATQAAAWAKDNLDNEDPIKKNNYFDITALGGNMKAILNRVHSKAMHMMRNNSINARRSVEK